MKSVQEYIKLCNEGKIESSIYTSKDELGRMVIIRIQKDAGAVVSTLQSNEWWEEVEYDANGFQQGVIYRKDDKDENK